MIGKTDPHDKSASVARSIGRLLQGLFLGPALVLAIIKLVSVAGNLTAFKYQGF
jgi:hypothetical protein